MRAASSHLTVTETPAHTPKNRPSYRTIPVCQTVILALQDWIAALPKRHPQGRIFFPKKEYPTHRFAKDRGARVGCFSCCRFTHIFSWLLKDARKEGVDIPEKFIPRELRASFITAMREARVDYFDLQRYVGQSPGTVLSAHYDHVSIERLREIAAQADAIFSVKSQAPLQVVGD